MNNRIKKHSATQEKHTQQQSRNTDYRILVLLTFGLIVITFHFSGILLPEKDKDPNDQDPNLIWLAGHNIINGLYSLPPSSPIENKEKWQDLYAAIGLFPPLAANATHITFPALNNQQNEAAGFWLEDYSLPVEISLPAHIYPLYHQPLPINRSDSELLSTIPGIGDQLAKKISTLRQKKGTFSSANELLEVSGIGPRKLQVIRKYLAFN